MLIHVFSKVILYALHWMQTIAHFGKHGSNLSSQLRTEFHLN